MNYRHHFHAGNFADVMKHVLLLQILTRLNQKDKPYRYIDTHGGAGKYDLSTSEAQKSGEVFKWYSPFSKNLMTRLSVMRLKVFSSI